MKVKIGNALFDSDVEPIMIVLDHEEKELVLNMGDQGKLCVAPNYYPSEAMTNFMHEEAHFEVSKDTRWLDTREIWIDFIIPTVILVFILSLVLYKVW